MIKFSLKCSLGHAFESWFQDNDGFETLARAGHLSCPQCGDAAITKALMAPSVSTARKAEALTSAPPAPAEPGPAAPTPEGARYVARPDAVRREVEARLRALRAHVEANADYVGSGFATEARRIHEGEAESRAIYGEATPEEAEELRDEGVPCARVPWIDRRDD